MSSLCFDPRQFVIKLALCLGLSWVAIDPCGAQILFQVPTVKDVEMLQISNISSAPTEAWLGDTNFHFKGFEKKAWDQDSIQSLAAQRSLIRVLTYSKNLKVQVRASARFFQVPQQTHARFKLPLGTDFYLINSTTQLNRWFLDNEEQTPLQPFEARRVKNSNLKPAQIRTAFRAQLFSPKIGFSVGLMDSGSNPFLSSNSQFHFVVSNLDRSSSYILRTENAKLAQEARDVLKTGTSKLVFAKIKPAELWKNNVDTYHATQSPWSWEVEEFIGLGDFGSQACDGTPQMVEEYLPYFLNYQPIICFWSYHLEQEIYR